MNRYINRLFHVCITVADIEAALGFYCGVLGLESVGTLRNEKCPDGAVLGFPGQELEIHADHLCGKNKENATVIDLIEFIHPKTTVATGPYPPLNQAGLNRMAFSVDDTDAIYEILRQRSDIEMFCEPVTVNAPDGGELRILTFRDPFGVVMELIEYRAPAK